MAWFILLIAGLCEIGWATGLKYSEGFTRLVPSVLTIVTMVVSRKDFQSDWLIDRVMHEVKPK